MIIWLNGSFGVGKSETAKALQKKLNRSHIYDPEQVGYFLWDNFPQEFRKGDFQDISLWRSVNFEVLKYLYRNYDGHIIVPMTIVCRQYEAEIIGRLSEEGVKLRHFILMASKDIIRKRLSGRGEEAHSWPEQQIGRCLRAFENDIKCECIATDTLTVEETADIILQKIDSGI